MSWRGLRHAAVRRFLAQPLRRCLERVGDERGTALVMALQSMVVLSIGLTAVLEWSSSNSRHASRSNAGQQAYALAEAGLNNAVAVLNQAYTSGSVSLASPPALLPERTSIYEGNTVRWSGVYCAPAGVKPPPCAARDIALWRVTSSARVQSATDAGYGDAVRTVTARVRARLPEAKPGSRVWSWVYSSKGPTPGLASTSCDTILGQSVVMKAPLYSRGNLCLDNSAQIQQPAVPSLGDCPSAIRIDCNRLMVGGWLWQRRAQNKVGLPTSGLSEAHIVGGCATNTSGPPNVFTPCRWDTDRVYVASSGRYTSFGAAALDPPTFNWSDWYTIAGPGPNFGCTTRTGTPPLFDNDGVMNNSVAPVFNLTPVNGYTCRSSGGFSDGELSWNPATRTLTIDGAIFIDGSAQVNTVDVATSNGWNPNKAIRYAGRGFLYVSGTFLVDRAELCATPTADWSGCDFAAWDPNTTAMGVAANGNGNGGSGSPPVGAGIQVVSGKFQGLLYATNDILVNTTGQSQGPMISLNTVSINQTGDLSFPPVNIAPGGTPDDLAKVELAPPDQVGG